MWRGLYFLLRMRFGPGRLLPWRRGSSFGTLRRPGLFLMRRRLGFVFVLFLGEGQGCESEK
jgi:hypothetical protein